MGVKYFPKILLLVLLLSILLLTGLLLGSCQYFQPAGTTPLTSATSSASGATTATTATTAAVEIDTRLTGLWTNESARTKVSVNAKGEPEGVVPVGEWYAFAATSAASGRYYRVARFMTFAIGGVSVEEGLYATREGVIYLTGKTESFFPDQGSPQKAKYRVPLEDSVLLYRFADIDGKPVLHLRTAPEEPEVGFARCLE